MLMKSIFFGRVARCCAAGLLLTGASYGQTPKSKSRATSSKTPEKSAQQALAFAEKYQELQRLKKKFDDPAFDRYVNLVQLGKAWDQLDSDLLTDVALQLAYAEDILQRSHKKLTADLALDLALKLAAETKNQNALARMSKAAEHYGKTELAARIKAAGELSLASRSTEMPASALLGLSAEHYRLYRTLIAEMTRCRVSEDSSRLKKIATGSLLQTLPEPLRGSIQKQIDELQKSVPVPKAPAPEASEGATNLPQLLQILSQANRAHEAAASLSPNSLNRAR